MAGQGEECSGINAEVAETPTSSSPLAGFLALYQQSGAHEG